MDERLQEQDAKVNSGTWRLGAANSARVTCGGNLFTLKARYAIAGLLALSTRWGLAFDKTPAASFGE